MAELTTAQVRPSQTEEATLKETQTVTTIILTDQARLTEVTTIVVTLHQEATLLAHHVL